MSARPVTRPFFKHGIASSLQMSDGNGTVSECRFIPTKSRLNSGNAPFQWIANRTQAVLKSAMMEEMRKPILLPCNRKS
jgi:hypothetical protein